MELSLHTAEVVSISTRKSLLPSSVFISVITLYCSNFSRFIYHIVFLVSCSVMFGIANAKQEHVEIEQA